MIDVVLSIFYDDVPIELIIVNMFSKVLYIYLQHLLKKFDLC